MALLLQPTLIGETPDHPPLPISLVDGCCLQEDVDASCFDKLVNELGVDEACDNFVTKLDDQ